MLGIREEILRRGYQGTHGGDSGGAGDVPDTEFRWEKEPQNNGCLGGLLVHW